MGNSWFALSKEDIYADDVGPARGLAKVLEDVGNCLADKKGMPAPGHVEEATDSLTSVKGWILDETKEYYDLKNKYWTLGDRVIEEKMGIAFESYPEKEVTREGVNWEGLLTEVTKVEDVLFGLAKKYSRKHSFKVNGYRSSRKALLNNIDRLTSDSHIEQVKAAISNYGHGREGLIWILEDELADYRNEFAKKRLGEESPTSIAYSTAQHWPTNVEKVFGLDFEGYLRKNLRNEIESKRTEFYQKQAQASA